MKHVKSERLAAALAIIAIAAMLGIPALLFAHVMYSWLAPETFWERAVAIFLSGLAGAGGFVLGIMVLIAILELTE
ncbi:MAG: hypothetical protein DRN26_02660 [Thermoplasmata archaeon]|nr:MAG: hypothetical protein DRN26_02660 [Thermoplasmata archaeon]